LFAAGQMLYHDDLAALADYTRQITRLMMRSLFGCGVVCGLCVKVSFACNKLTVVIDPGVALDCEGDPVHVPKTTTITIDPTCDIDSLADRLWVVLRGFEKCCAPRAAVCSSDEDEVASVCTREQYWYEIQVRDELPDCVCRCSLPEQDDESSDDAPEDRCRCADPDRDCYKDHYGGKCACACPDCTTCKCEWILLAQLDKTDDPGTLGGRAPRPAVRSPVLIRDPGCKEKDEAEEGGRDEAEPLPIVKSTRSSRRKPTRTGPSKGTTPPTG
jgi:hypothetical protein